MWSSRIDAEGRPADVVRQATTSVVLAGVLLAVAGTAWAQQQARVHTGVEGWFRTDVLAPGPDDPSCELPSECRPAGPGLDPTGHPPDTLHVAVELGQERAYTALGLDLTALPAGADLIAGTLILPVADAEAGTEAPEAADMIACLLSEPPVDAHGAPAADGPAFSCETSAPARLSSASPSPVFTVDLDPFIAAWASGSPDHGVALVASPEPSDPIATWHLAFSGRDRQVDGAVPISAQVSYTTPPESGSPPPPVPPRQEVQPPPAPADGVGDAPTREPIAPNVPIGVPQAAPPAQVSDPATASAPAPPAAGVTATARTRPFFHAYPVAWLLPLLAGALCVSLARSLTTPLSVPAGPDRSLLRDVFVGPAPGPAPPEGAVTSNAEDRRVPT